MQFDAKLDAAMEGLRQVQDAVRDAAGFSEVELLNLLLIRTNDYIDNAIQAIETARYVHPVLQEFKELEEQAAQGDAWWAASRSLGGDADR